MTTAIATLFLVNPMIGMSQDGPSPAEIGNCEECVDSADTNIVNGTLEAISFKASMLQLATISGATVVQFNDETILTGAGDFSAIRPGSNLKIEYLKKDGVLLAVGIEATIKASAVLPANQISAGALADFLSDKTAAVALIDARSASSFNREHIPGAISISTGTFDKNRDKLPAERDHLIVYYCDGTT
ncbi:MAG: rhodanese-like domain-containing protein [Desulforhopalus sp.]